MKKQQYCVEKMVARKRMFVPLDPQPSLDQILNVRRSYQQLKAFKDYTKRITWVESEVTCIPKNAVYAHWYISGISCTR